MGTDPAAAGMAPQERLRRLNELNDEIRRYFDRLDYDVLAEALRNWDGEPPLKDEIREHFTKKALGENAELVAKLGKQAASELVHQSTVAKTRTRLTTLLKSLAARGTVRWGSAVDYRKEKKGGWNREEYVYVHADRVRTVPGGHEWIPHREWAKLKR